MPRKSKPEPVSRLLKKNNAILQSGQVKPYLLIKKLALCNEQSRKLTVLRADLCIIQCIAGS